MIKIKCNKTQQKSSAKAKMISILNQTDFSNSHSFSYRYNLCMLSHMQTTRPVWWSCGLTSISCVQHRGQGIKFTFTSLGYCSMVTMNRFLDNFCTILGIKELLWMTFFLRILFTASFINLRQSSCWHSRKSSVLKPHCHPATISEGLLLIFVLFLCAYQFHCH